MRCIVIRGDAWLVLLSPCNTTLVHIPIVTTQGASCKSTHTRRTYTGMRPHSPGQQAGGHLSRGSWQLLSICSSSAKAREVSSCTDGTNKPDIALSPHVRSEALKSCPLITRRQTLHSACYDPWGGVPIIRCSCPLPVLVSQFLLGALIQWLSISTPTKAG